jgi:hypothetical protein
MTRFLAYSSSVVIPTAIGLFFYRKNPSDEQFHKNFRHYMYVNNIVNIENDDVIAMTKEQGGTWSF